MDGLTIIDNFLMTTSSGSVGRKSLPVVTSRGSWNWRRTLSRRRSILATSNVCWPISPGGYLRWRVSSVCQEFRLFKPFRLSFFRTQDSFPTNTHSRHDITRISRTTELIVLYCNEENLLDDIPTLVDILKP